MERSDRSCWRSVCVTPPTSSLLLNLELVFTTVLAGVVFRDHIGSRITAGTALVVVASVLLAGGEAEVRVGALLIGAFGYGASITLWVAGARDLGAARGQLVFATAPFVGAIVAWTALGDEVAVRAVAALAVAAAGVAMVLRSGHVHEHRHVAVVHDHEHDHDDGHHEHVHADGFTGRHQHVHEHAAVVHRHLHLPDLSKGRRRHSSGRCSLASS